MALSSARRGHTQRRRYRMDPRSHRGAHDAARHKDDSGRHDLRGVPRSVSAGIDSAGRGGRPRRSVCGLIIVSEAHSSQFDGQASVRAALRHVDDVLFPVMNVREAVAAFDGAEAEALAVVDFGRLAAGRRDFSPRRMFCAAMRMNWSGTRASSSARCSRGARAICTPQAVRQSSVYAAATGCFVGAP